MVSRATGLDHGFDGQAPVIVSLEHGFVFVKGIKVGGSSVELFLSQVLGERAIVAPANIADPGFRPRNYSSVDFELYNHATALEARRFLGPARFSAMRRALIIRNPFEKIRSYVYFRMSKGTTGLTVDRAIEGCSTEATRALDENGDSLITDIIFYERLDQDLTTFFASVGVPFSGRLDHFEKAWQRKQFGHVAIAFSPAQQDAVRAKFAFEFACYAKAALPVDPNPPPTAAR